MTFARGDWFFVILILIVSLLMSRPYVYVIQQDNYRLAEIFKSRRLRFVYLIDILSVCVFLLIWTLCYFLQARAFWGFAAAMFFFIAEFALYFMEDLPEKKKPLRYTKRAVRCMIFVSVTASGVMVAAMGAANVRLSEVYLRYLLFFAYPLVFPLLFLIFCGIENAFERLNNLRYERRSRRILAKRPDLIKIGITGSYGKTSVKNILSAILSTEYNVLSTPASYNTPMGISKTLKSLDQSHEVFIAEMGARRKGDIKKLMRIVRPTHTILTGVNDQHLETFKTRENILREKSYVISMLTGDGFSVASDTVKARLEGLKIKKITVRMPVYAGFDKSSDVVASNVRVTESGSRFSLEFDGKTYLCETPLLGFHNIEDIALAAALAFGLDVRPDRIVSAISSLEPIPHRMQLIEGNGIRIIDDTFNSNPDGARASLDVMDLFEGRKVVVTPGLVELGESEYEENYKLGKRVCESADVIMLIGEKRSEPLRRAIRDAEFAGEVYTYDSLKQAENDFRKVLRLNDVLLLLNDLPDCYDDK